MVFRANIGCCCCCPRESVPFVKSFSLLGIVLSSVKIFVYVVMMLAHSGPLCAALFFGFLLNVAVLTFSIILRCKAKNPNFKIIKRFAVLMLVVLCVEIVVTLIGVVVAGFSLTGHHQRHYRDEDFGDRGKYYRRRRDFEEEGETSDSMEDADYEYRSFDFGNFVSALLALYSFLVFFGLLVWQLFAAVKLLKCAQYELRNAVEEEDSDETSDEEVAQPRPKRKKARRKAKGFKDTQEVQIVVKKKKSRKQSPPKTEYVEFEDVREARAQPPLRKVQVKYAQDSEDSFEGRSA